MKEPFGPSRRLEIAYERRIHQLVGEALPTKRADQTFEEWINELIEVSNRGLFAPFAEKIAAQMVRTANAENLRSWQRAARWSSHSRQMHRLLKRELAGPIGAKYDAIIAQNAQLIRSVPVEVAQHLSARLAKAQLAGMRSESLARMIQADYPRLTTWKVRLISRTEVAKASTALTQVRAEDIGVHWFVWRTSRDGAVRKSHRNMEGVIIAWDDPPNPEELVGQRSTLSRYLPGCCPNCRCGTAPLMSLRDVQWPRRVYVNGSIQRMGRIEFAQMTGMPEKIAA